MKLLLGIALFSLASMWAQVVTGSGTNSGTGPTGPSGLSSGNLADIPATCTTGLQLYQATDQAISMQLWACTGTNTWTRVAYPQGTSLPGTCLIGQVYFKTDATAGRNWYFCTASNTWMQQLNDGGNNAISGTPIVLTQGGNLTLPAATANYSVTLAAAQSCNTRWSRSLISVTTTFTGGTGGLWAKIQHGSVDLTSQFDLTQTGGDINWYQDTPGLGCMGASTADLKLTFVGNGVNNLSGYTAGAVTVEAEGHAK